MYYFMLKNIDLLVVFDPNTMYISKISLAFSSLFVNIVMRYNFSSSLRYPYTYTAFGYRVVWYDSLGGNKSVYTKELFVSWYFTNNMQDSFEAYNQ